jgi:hypothetical protein
MVKKGWKQKKHSRISKYGKKFKAGVKSNIDTTQLIAGLLANNTNYADAKAQGLSYKEALSYAMGKTLATKIKKT